MRGEHLRGIQRDCFFAFSPSLLFGGKEAVIDTLAFEVSVPGLSNVRFEEIALVDDDKESRFA
jgi:hypothetical protein